ncbi:MAG: winged helix-turn-helix domain-containing protein [candidate division WOR-3 bacterium]|nr:winged helix-turn-helix domain-containing protein [candidate division WOR-3 bacterium]
MDHDFLTGGVYADKEAVSSCPTGANAASLARAGEVGRQSPSLAPSQGRVALLGTILDSGPVAYGLNTGIWTCPAIQHVIEEEFGIAYHHDHVRKILHNLGFSVHRPGKKLALAEPELQQRWVRRTYPALKKSAARHVE